MIYWTLQIDKKITYKHLIRQMSWVGMYYLFVSKGLNCRKQYTKYPWKRQVFTTATMPFFIRISMNQWMKNNKVPAFALLSFVIILHEYFNLSDEAKQDKLHALHKHASYERTPQKT